MEEQKVQSEVNLKPPEDNIVAPQAMANSFAADTVVDIPKPGGAAPGALSEEELFQYVDVDKELDRARRLAAEHKCIGGRYTILELLGMGAYGSVYKVRHELLGKVFAMKLLNPTVSAEFKVIQRFHQEAKAVAELTHPNLISVHDFGVTEDGAPYLVMDYLEGTSLESEIEKHGHLDENRVISIFLKVCEGLGYAHKKGIVHRDLKPSNIMLVKDEHGKEIPKIVDFGIAKRQAVDAKLTQTGDVFGTPLYMSPEQCLGNPVDARSDIYSLGCIMYECLSGKEAYAAANVIQTIFRHVHEDPKPLRKACEGFDVSSGIEQVVGSCLERQPEQRPPSADGLACNLDRLAHGKAPVNARKLPKIRRSALNTMALIGSTFIVTMLLCIYFLVPKQDTYMKTISDAADEEAHGNYKQALVLAQKAVMQANAKGASASPSNLMGLHQYIASYAAKVNDPKLTVREDLEVSRLAELAGDKAKAGQYALIAAKFEQSIDLRTAQQYYKRAVAAEAQLFGNDSPRLVPVLLDAAASAERCHTLDDMKVCLSYCEQAAKIAQSNERSHDLSPSTRFELYRTLGESYACFDRFAEADKALALAESAAREAQLDASAVEQDRKNVQKKLKAQPGDRSTPD